MSEDILQRVLELDPQQVWFFLGDVLRNPTSNLTAFVLIIALITGFVLLGVLVLILGAMGTPEERRQHPVQGHVRDEDEADVVVHDESAVDTAGSESRPDQAHSRATGLLVWVLAAVVVWVAAGYTSGHEAVCLSCHVDDSGHDARLEDPGTDPHSGVACGSCHESPRLLARVTTALPGRAVHYVAASVREPLGRGYGSPIRNDSCSYCHSQALEGTHENPDRGVRMSHAEPLEARAWCLDCHVPDPATGVVDRFTRGMEPCLRCHDGDNAPAECSYCHTRDVGYAVHSRGVPAPRVQVQDITCGGCHSEESCDACHGIRMPHSEAFKGPGHARAAAEDIWFNQGGMCTGCHKDDRRSCSTCHRGTFPAHGGSSFAQGHQVVDPDSNGCDNCHNYLAWIGGRHFCANCHPQYAPNQVVVPQER